MKKKYYPAPEMVDLGLPSGLKWAKCNIGASKETDYGLYFKWGEAEGHTSSELNHFDTKYPAEFTDAATAAYGEGYRMPTREDFKELRHHTDRFIEIIDGVLGIKFVNHADSSKYIFIPFTGYCYDGSFNYAGSHGYLWSRTLFSTGDAFYLACDRSGAYFNGGSRFCGLSVRAVSEQ